MLEHKFAAVLMVLFLTIGAASADVFGVPTITDGDTLRFGSIRVRLFGIDSPELQQTCERGGVTWLCGQEGVKALRELIAGQSLVCSARDKDRYKRIIAVCVLPDGRDIGAVMVLSGLALDYVQYSSGMYEAEENEAREAGRGMWGGEFVKPWEWRRKK